MRWLALLMLVASTLTSGAHAEPAVSLVETAPIETTLDHADLTEAADVWVTMIDAAKARIDMSELYATSQPGSRLEPVIAALSRAGARGVKVRMLFDAGFAMHEPTTVARLEQLPALSVRRFDWAARGGGVLHAKYFVVDGAQVFIGSQNFDWRSLTHIQELGVRMRSHQLAATLDDVFETDWALAGGAPRAQRVQHATTQYPLALDGAKVTFVASPRGWLPDESMWDLPKIVTMIDEAHVRVRVQLLTYRASADFDQLESALRRAAARGVDVELLVSDWCKAPALIEGLKRLTVTQHVTVKLMSLPVAASGFIPYARVVHAKYLVVDGMRAWVGTSNWERDYFYASRNVGLIFDGGALPARLDRFFADDWSSRYATKVDPAASYTAPRTH